MAHIVVIYNNVPDRSLLSQDLKSELEVLQVAEGVAAALRGHHRVTVLPFTGDVILLSEQLRSLKPNAVFNLFEGVFGFSPSEVFVPITLDLLGIPYTGSPAKTLEACVKKSLTKKILLRRSIPTPPFQVFAVGAPIEPQLSFPIFVKPECEDASLGVSNDSVVYTPEQLESQVKTIWQKFSQPALCEAFIDGREFNVAILGDPDHEQTVAHPFAPKVLPISEICFGPCLLAIRILSATTPSGKIAALSIVKPNLFVLHLLTLNLSSSLSKLPCAPFTPWAAATTHALIFATLTMGSSM